MTKLGAAIALGIVLTTSGCRQPPVKERHDVGETRKLLLADLEGDLVLTYVVSWGPGRSVMIELEREGEQIEAGATSTWNKSSLMPVVRWALRPDDATIGRLLGLVADAGLVSTEKSNPGDPECMLRVEVPGGIFSRQGECAEIGGSSFDEVSSVLHPWWFSASHLLAAGIDAEPQIDAKNVYGYYTNGIDILGTRYGPLSGDITVDQVAAADEAYGNQEWVQAVISVRNALSARVNFYRKTRMTALSPAQIDPPSGPE
jgi:hypothetical protein